MTDRFYDAIVLGRGIGALTAAALLARRDFTVLVLGQGARPPTYLARGRPLQRRAFAMLAASSPAWRRVLAELAQSQSWKQRAHAARPMLQILSPRRRLEIPAQPELFAREVDRELSDVGRLVEELYEELARVNQAADEAFQHDAVWPPGSFWERRETTRYAALLPHARAEPDADLLSEFPKGHPFRAVVAATVQHGTHLAMMPPPFAVARIHGSWTRGLEILPGGEEELEAMLVERIQAYGGRAELAWSAESLVVSRGRVAGVLVAGDREPIGASFVLTDTDGEGVAALSGGRGIQGRALREWPRMGYPMGRFVVSIVAREEGVPEPLGPESFILAGWGADPRTRRAGRRTIHLERRSLPRGEALLVAETLVLDRGPDHLAGLREEVLAAVMEELPFLERHLILVDSPHDGRPLWVWEGGARRDVERWEERGLSHAPEPMRPLVEVDPPGYLGLAGEPIRGPIERTLLLGPTVLPGLGQEGELLAAWGAARLVTKSDKRRARIREDMWSKIEIG